MSKVKEVSKGSEGTTDHDTSEAMEKNKGISEEEATQYDRQIRLWGLAAQNRLHSTRVLVIGMTGLSAEVCKNLVLAGIKSIKLVDHNQLTKDDLTSNFLASNQSLGNNRAEASVQRLQQLNPRVDVTHTSSDIEMLSNEEIDTLMDNVDILLASDLMPDQTIRLNEAARRKNVKFFAGQVCGFFGFFFVDLIRHKYVEEVLKTSGDDNDKGSAVALDDDDDENDVESPSKKAKVEEIPELVKVERSMSFVPFSEALKTSKLSGRRLKRMDVSFMLMHLLIEFESRQRRQPSCHEEDDRALIKSLKTSIESKFSRQVDDNLINLLTLKAVSPVCAIVGGTMAQEMIKVIAGQAKPHDNCFLFNPTDSAGVIERIGYDP